MSEWWTYTLHDFLMFAPATYQRLFARYNAAVWPLQVPALVLGCAAWWMLARHPARWRAAVAITAAGWLWTAWAFHWQRYAGIHTAAPWFAGAFALQALWLAWMARPGSAWQPRTAPGALRWGGLAVFAGAVLVLPLVGSLFGRPWQEAALFGLAPDATALGTLGLLLSLQRRPAAAWATVLVWTIPVLWCAFSAATLWTLDMRDGAVLALAGAAAVLLGLYAGGGPRITR